MRIRVSADGAREYPLTAFDAARERPGSYPGDFPFVAGTPVVLGEGDGGGGPRRRAWAVGWS